jgi:hypothetical protein
MSNSIPREYLGQARQFWFDLTEHTQQTVSRLTLVIQKTQRAISPKSNALRPERFAELAKEWRSYRNDGCSIEQTVEMKRKKYLFLEYFIAPVPNKGRDNQDIDYAVGVWQVRIAPKSGTVSQPIVTVSLQALAMWIERTGVNLRNINQIRDDLIPLLLAYSANKKFARTKDGGLWLGDYEKIRIFLLNNEAMFYQVLNIDTYLSAPEIGLRNIEGYDC